VFRLPHRHRRQARTHAPRDGHSALPEVEVAVDGGDTGPHRTGDLLDGDLTGVVQPLSRSSRSTAATAPTIVKISRPAGVAVSMPRLRIRNPILCSSRLVEQTAEVADVAAEPRELQRMKH
jgi:hypothetical protein